MEIEGELEVSSEQARVYENVISWFLSYGFTYPQAAALALARADHHEAKRMLDQGCPVDVCFDILT